MSLIIMVNGKCPLLCNLNIHELLGDFLTTDFKEFNLLI